MSLQVAHHINNNETTLKIIMVKHLTIHSSKSALSSKVREILVVKNYSDCPTYQEKQFFVKLFHSIYQDSWFAHILLYKICCLLSCQNLNHFLSSTFLCRNEKQVRMTLQKGASHANLFSSVNCLNIHLKEFKVMKLFF